MITLIAAMMTVSFFVLVVIAILDGDAKAALGFFGMFSAGMLGLYLIGGQ